MKRKDSEVRTAHVGVAPVAIARNRLRCSVSERLKAFKGRIPPWLATRSAYVFIVLPFLLGLSYVYCYGTNIGWEDGFGFMLDLLPKCYARTLTWANLWAQRNEHRIVVSFWRRSPSRWPRTGTRWRRCI